MFFFDDGDFKSSPLIKVTALLDCVVERELTVDGVVGTAADFVAFFGGVQKAAFGDSFVGVCTLAFGDDFVGVAATAAVLEVFFWPELFMPFAELLFFGFDAVLFFFCFDLPLAVTFAGLPAHFFLHDFVMTRTRT